MDDGKYPTHPKTSTKSALRAGTGNPRPHPTVKRLERCWPVVHSDRRRRAKRARDTL